MLLMVVVVVMIVVRVMAVRVVDMVVVLLLLLLIPIRVRTQLQPRGNDVVHRWRPATHQLLNITILALRITLCRSNTTFSLAATTAPTITVGDSATASTPLATRRRRPVHKPHWADAHHILHSTVQALNHVLCLKTAIDLKGKEIQH